MRMPAPLTSIVILTRNELALTRACVDSIQRHTPEPYEFVFVDNASTDGTLEYLHGVEGATVIDNDANLGFGGGCNQGIAASRGERILLLNNDVVVTSGWLAALHRGLDADPKAGLTGPRSNRVADVQQVDDVGYDVETLEGLDDWADRWVREHAGETTAIARLVGFCMLVERAVIDRIGGFDLRYGLGNFEDDDFCLRAGVAGFECHVVHDSWVHHHGSRTFQAEGIDYGATMRENFERFVQAWRMTSQDIDPATGAYFPRAVLDRTVYEASRHYAPLVGVPAGESRIELGAAREHVVAVCCDRLDTESTSRVLEGALRAWSDRDDVTLAIRIDPRDVTSMPALEAAADVVGDARLPDIAIIPARDEHDGALLRLADCVVVDGRFGSARAALARTRDCDVHTLEDLQHGHVAAAA